MEPYRAVKDLVPHRHKGQTRHVSGTKKERFRMLYESTRGLLQSILQSLEAGDQARWDDQTESGNACLYEMHQMAGPLYKAYRSDNLNANSRAQVGFPQKLTRAMPHARMMVIAIRHKDRDLAIESGKAALAEMNYNDPPGAAGGRTLPGTTRGLR